jgi:hypothetical protein
MAERPASSGPRFSWRRGLLHALVPFAVLIVSTVTIAAAADVADPRRFGEGVGRLSVFVFGGGFGVSYLAQTGRKQWALAAGVAGAALLVAVIALALALGWVDLSR